jgi:hypothetical protein
MQQHPRAVYDEDGTPIGDYYADLLVDSQLIIELGEPKMSRPLYSRDSLLSIGMTRHRPPPSPRHLPPGGDSTQESSVMLWIRE